ncbi:hypothetical protein ACU4GD_14210 [Cupriavidus basilensis]
MNDFSVEPPVTFDLTGKDSPRKVTAHSPRWMRDMVEVLAHFAKKERNYDSSPFDAAERPLQDDFYPYEAYLFHDVARDLIEEDQLTPSRAIGAVCFRNIGTAADPIWTLQWAWFHPFVRARGLFSDFRPKLKTYIRQLYGPTAAVVATMKAFLTRHGESIPAD